MRSNQRYEKAALATCLVMAAACAAASCALLNPALHDLDRQNQAALNDYRNGRFQPARTKLIAAIDYAEKKGIADGASAARSHLYLGMVYAGGMKRTNRGVEHMTMALERAPDLRIPKDLYKPGVAQAFSRAKKEADRSRARRAREQIAPGKVEDSKRTDLAQAEPPAPQKPEKKMSRRERARAEREARRKAPKEAKEAKEAKQPKEPKEAKEAKQPPKEAKQPVTPPAVLAPPPGGGADETAAAAPPPPPPSPEEVAVPHPLDTDVYCPLPDVIPAGQPLTVWCGVQPSLAARTVTVLVRPHNETEFRRLPTERSEKGWYVAKIDGAMIQGSMLQYYVEVQASGGRVVATTGDFSSPELILIREDAPAVSPLMTQQRLDGETGAGATISGETESEDPFRPEEPAGLQDEDEDEDEDDGGPITFDWKNLWFGFQIGSGWGWHASGPYELRSMQEAPSGTAAASLLHILPEAGYTLNRNWEFSLQLRQQFITGEGDAGGIGSPAKGAFSAFLRAAYRLWSSEKATVFATGAVGGGEGFRLVHGADAAAGLTGTDTVRGGPFVVGPGASLLYRLTPAFSLTLELRALLGLPDTALIGELNGGLRFDL